MKLSGVNGAPMAEKTPAVKDPVCGMYMDSRLAVRLENRLLLRRALH